MATNPSNANSGLTFPATDSSESSPATDQRDALQALLAFSTLNDQIRRRREEDARRYAAGLGSAHNPWEYQQFVLDEVLQLVAERAQGITGADGIAIALAEGDAIICRASVGAMSPDRGARIDPKTGFSGACLAICRIIRCDDAESDPRVDVAACRRLGVRSMVAVPLLGQESVVGLVEAFSTRPFGFTDNHVRSLNLLAELIIAALKPEDQERIVRAARAATADFEAAELEKLRHISFTEPSVPTGDASIAAAESDDTPLEFSRENIAPPLFVAEDAGNSRRPLLVGGALVLAAVLAVAGLWWRWHAKPLASSSGSSTGQTGALLKPPTEPTAMPAIAPVAATDDTSSSATGAASSNIELAPNGTPRVTGVQHWASDHTSTVAINLQAEVQYETHRLDHPDRIYFDLRDTELVPGLNGKTIAVADGQVVKIRVAQPASGTTRVVLETQGVANFSVRMEQNPYRLMIEIRGPEAKPVASTVKVEPATATVSTPKPTVSDSGSKANQSAPALPTPSPASPLHVQKSAHASVPPLRIVVDAGHGGWDLGTVGRHGLLEKDLVLDVAQRLGAVLQAKLGCEVIFTRKDDSYLSLEQRAELANQAQADLFLSVHANYSNLASARGVETYYSSFFSPPEARELEYGENLNAKPVTEARLSGMELKGKVDGSRKLAADVQHALFGSLTADNPGIRNRGVREASYVVLTGTEMPSILTEISFVSSPEDEGRLQNPTYREQIAEAVAKGVAQYLSISQHVKIASAKSGGR